MKQVSLTEFKNEFSALVDLVRQSKESLLVSVRGIPVIKVMSATETGDQPEEALLSNLERAGYLKRASEPISSLNVKELLACPKRKVDILSALLADREEGR